MTKRIANTIVLEVEKHRMPAYLREYVKAYAKKFLKANPDYTRKYPLTDFKCWKSYQSNIFIHKGGAVLQEQPTKGIRLRIGDAHPKGYIALGYRLLHRIVASVWIKNKTPEKTPIVNHKNGIKTDNCVDNLEWCSNSQNILHARATGLNPYNKPTSGLKIGGQRKGASEYYGVLFERGRQKWVGQVRHNNVLYFRRRFETEIEAAKHYNNVCDILEISEKPRNPFRPKQIRKYDLSTGEIWVIGKGRFRVVIEK